MQITCNSQYTFAPHQGKKYAFICGLLQSKNRLVVRAKEPKGTDQSPRRSHADEQSGTPLTTSSQSINHDNSPARTLIGHCSCLLDPPLPTVRFACAAGQKCFLQGNTDDCQQSINQDSSRV
uniref:Uncharacterized protein n=1 Tax=Plectus sambesii TaxID=2011161 RepID=A0A914W7Q7_9BILA